MSIFDEQISRKPNKYPWADEFADTMHDGFWTVREFSFSSDVQDFKVSNAVGNCKKKPRFMERLIRDQHSPELANKFIESFKIKMS